MKSEKNIKNLTEIGDGHSVIVVSVEGGRNATKRLADLGLTVGTELQVLRRAFFSGPIEIKVSGSRLALGRGLASKIMVELK